MIKSEDKKEHANIEHHSVLCINGAILENTILDANPLLHNISWQDCVPLKKLLPFNSCINWNFYLRYLFFPRFVPISWYFFTDLTHKCFEFLSWLIVANFIQVTTDQETGVCGYIIFECLTPHFESFSRLIQEWLYWLVYFSTDYINFDDLEILQFLSGMWMNKKRDHLH